MGEPKVTERNATAPCGRAPSAYPWMALASFVAIVAAKFLLPFSSQQAQNISLIVEALGGAALGLAVMQRLRRGRCSALTPDNGAGAPAAKS